MNEEANRLIHSSSPYLLQHAYNPVNWYPWGEEALTKAREENKLILVSIGYSACHWCHVMERESFENHEVAEIMNQHFVCIKVDREERPDIDQVYMLAVQLMTGQGGWPLNCICLPDQRPIYGGTYFKKGDWMNLLLNLNDYWNKKPEDAIAYAVKLTEGVRQSETLIKATGETEHEIADIKAVIEPWKRRLDMAEGGYNRAPKFPLPNNWQFFLRYARLMQDDGIHIATMLTLHKMAFGGIYDQLAGGFARYSVDEYWHVPHFEKMLYDNAQLVSLYAEAYQYSGDPLFKDIVYEALDWVKNEMTSPENGFYSALDADSEGVEGKFYTWDKEELKAVLGQKEEVFSIYYSVTDEGNWHEERTNILMRHEDDETLAAQLGMTVTELKEEIKTAKRILMAARNKRIRPGLDDKILTAWNAMMLKAYVDAYRVFADDAFLQAAIANANFIANKLVSDGGALKRSYKNGKASINGFLDDYAFVIEAFISLYEATFDEQWLNNAQSLLDYCLGNFSDDETSMFFYTSIKDEELIARKHEIMDNVIPASNSVMAHNLKKMGLLFDNELLVDRSKQMLANVKPQIKGYGSAYSNWSILLLEELFGVYEIAFTGRDAMALRKELDKEFVPNKIVLGGEKGTLPLLKDKMTNESKIFVCRNKTCQLPVNNVADALKQMVLPIN